MKIIYSLLFYFISAIKFKTLNVQCSPDVINPMNTLNLYRIPEDVLIPRQKKTKNMYKQLKKNVRRKFKRSRAVVRTGIKNATQKVVRNLKQILVPKREDMVLNITELLSRDIDPLLVFVNRKSGGKRGNLVLKALEGVLSEYQICDLSCEKPKHYFNMYRGMPSSRLRILCCGGDGSIQWVMNEAYDAGLYNATFQILPLGTGNDLYHYLLGNITVDPVETLLSDPIGYISRFVTNNTMSLDRWALRFKTNPLQDTSQLNASLPKRTLLSKAWGYATKRRRGVLRTMNNYFGVGVDGAISLKFHSARNTMPYFFFSSVINKFWYACVSMSTMLSGRSIDLNRFMEIKCDGNVIDIPPYLQGIVLLNINSYAGGSQLWLPRNLSRWDPLSFSDGIIEVVGVQGVGHLGQIKAGFASGIKLAQGRRIQISTRDFLPMQIDGEPWMQRPCKIDVRLLHKVKISIPLTVSRAMELVQSKANIRKGVEDEAIKKGVGVGLLLGQHLKNVSEDGGEVSIDKGNSSLSLVGEEDTDEKDALRRDDDFLMFFDYS